MAKKSKSTVPFRRKLEGKTNYKKRLALLKSKKPRLVVRPSLNNVSAQLVDFSPSGDKVIVSAHSRQLIKLGWKAARGNLPASYLVGYLLGKKALEMKIKQAVLDMGLRHSVKASRVYAVLKGAVDAGLDVPCSETVFPSDDRIAGKHIADYSKTVSGKEGQKHVYSKYIKNSLKPEELPKHFEELKKKLSGNVAVKEEAKPVAVNQKSVKQNAEIRDA